MILAETYFIGDKGYCQLVFEFSSTFVGSFLLKNQIRWTSGVISNWLLSTVLSLSSTMKQGFRFTDMPLYHWLADVQPVSGFVHVSIMCRLAYWILAFKKSMILLFLSDSLCIIFVYYFYQLSGTIKHRLKGNSLHQLWSILLSSVSISSGWWLVGYVGH